MVQSFGGIEEMEHKSIYERWFGIKPIIPFGYPWMTDTGGARLSEEVVEAMAEARLI